MSPPAILNRLFQASLMPNNKGMFLPSRLLYVVVYVSYLDVIATLTDYIVVVKTGSVETTETDVINVRRLPLLF